MPADRLERRQFANHIRSATELVQPDAVSENHDRLGSSFGVSPVSSPRYVHHSSMLTCSLPPQLTIVGGMAALTVGGFAKVMGVLAVALAAVNVFGGFLVTRRMLEMFRKKDKKPAAVEAKP